MYLFQFLEVNNSYLKNLLGKIYYWLRIMSESNYDHGNELENNLASFPWFSFSCFGLALLRLWFRVIYLTWQSYERSFKFWFPDGAKTFGLVVLRVWFDYTDHSQSCSTNNIQSQSCSTNNLGIQQQRQRFIVLNFQTGPDENWTQNTAVKCEGANLIFTSSKRTLALTFILGLTVVFLSDLYLHFYWVFVGKLLLRTLYQCRRFIEPFKEGRDLGNLKTLRNHFKSREN